jgi:two-component system chemotaxis sensor kinase CheA
MDELTSVFIQESREQLTSMESGLLILEHQAPQPDDINSIFRAAHTIKGSSGVIECHFIESFMHKVENVLDRLRNDEIQITSGLTELLLKCCDHLGLLIDTLENEDSEPHDSVKANGDALLEQLSTGYLQSEGFQSAQQQSSGDDKSRDETASTLVEHAIDVQNAGNVVITDSWHISVRFGSNVMRGGMDPLSFIKFLGSQGEILAIETLSDFMPNAEEMDPESCYLGFEIHFQTRASKADIERVFDFVRDECELRIIPPNSKVSEYIQLIKELPEDDMRLGEILVRVGALTQNELDAGLNTQKSLSNSESTDVGEVEPPPAQIGEILSNQHQVVAKELVEAAAIRQAQITTKKAADARLIRVQADKLDHLIDLVGELVIAGASANLLAQRSGQSELVESTSILSRLVENIRDSALQLRMVQIGDTFTRFNRVVRDMSHELNKEIELVITGAETELDKTVVEKIGDPLMHLVRNALDHGIEPTAIRIQRGKTAKGCLELNAFHDSGSIVIEVKDDGSGLPKEKIYAKALEQGLVQSGQILSDQEIVNLIFEPGFSTASEVTNISGRGVGMDVVRRNIQGLRGTVDVTTKEGEGTCFSIRLPLTLAIIDGFQVGVCKSSYVIPLDMVIECIELHEDSADRNILNLRGEVLPFVRLRDILGVEGNPPPRENIVIVQYAGEKAGIVVDQLMGEFQTVIKPLSAIFKHLRGIGGSTILGTGEVALILDIQALIQRCVRGEGNNLKQQPLLKMS